MDDEQAPLGTPHDPSGEEPRAAEAPAVDVERLAQKVYTLMRDELRLEKARSAGRLRSR
jgi:hypothetical protein